MANFVLPYFVNRNYLGWPGVRHMGIMDAVKQGFHDGMRAGVGAVQGKSPVDVKFEALTAMIANRGLDDSFVQAECLEFIKLDRTLVRMKRLVDNLAEKRPEVLFKIHKTLKAMKA